MNVIFLDFNGVLDTYENIDEINIDNLKRLKYIIDETESKIVISSSLKNSYYHTGHYNIFLQKIINQIENIGIEVIGITPKAETREEEIKLYLQSHQEVSNYCILDDDYEMESLKEHLVKLPVQDKGSKGLQDIHMNKAIKILKKSRI